MTETRTHRCSRAINGKHEFDERGICRFCAIDFQEIRHFFPTRTAAAPNYDREETETAIRTFFKREK